MKIKAVLTIAALIFPYQDAASAPLDVFRDCDVCPEMIKLPMGSFMMGAKPNEVRRAWLLDGDAWKSVYRKDSEWFTKLDELPRHKVTVDIPIAMGRNEVTYDEWMACVDDGGCGGYVPSDRTLKVPSSAWIGGRHPVVRVSFEDERWPGKSEQVG